MGREEGDCGEACRRLAAVAAGTGGMCLRKRDEPMLVPPPLSLSLSPKELGIDSLIVKGVICFLLVTFM